MMRNIQPFRAAAFALVLTLALGQSVLAATVSVANRARHFLKRFLLAMCFVTIPVLAHSTTYYVATTGSDSNTCTQAQSSITPKRTINAALNCLGTAAGAGAGHTVQIAPGTYTETINNNLPGGTSWSAPFTLKAVVIGTVTIQPPTGAASCLMIARSTSKYAIISGLVCDAVNVTSDGIKVTDSNSNGAASFIRIQDTEIKNATRQGILVTRSTDNEFIRITSHDNGTVDNLDHGIYLGEAAHRTLIEDSLFYNNHAYGIQLYHLTTPPGGCIVRNNRSYTNGTGGLVIWATNTTACNNLIYNNHTAAGNLLGSSKSGIKVGSNSNGVKLYNNTVYGQKANSSDAGIQVSSGAANTEAKNNIAYSNATNITNSGTNTTLSNNLTTDPKFVDATITNDFHLQVTSPAIDAGVTLPAITDDYDGNARPQGPAYDIGGYEFAGALVAFNFSLANGGNQSVTQGASAINTISARLISGSAQSVSFSASGLPAGATAAFSPTACAPTCSTTLTISTTTSTPTGTYTITMTGTAGAVSHTTSFSLTVNPASTSFNFSLSNGGSKSVTQGASVSNTVSAALVSGTTQAVSFSASGLPAGASAAFSPTACAPACSTTLTLTTTASTPTGTYTITVASTGGGVTHTTSFNLTVSAPAAAGPIANWKFDETSGQTLTDSSGNGNTGNLGTNSLVETSDPTRISGRANNALRFDGVDDRGTISNTATLNTLSSFTYSAWIYPTGWGQNGYGRIVDKESSVGFDDFYFLVNSPDGNTLEVDLVNTAGTKFQSLAAANTLTLNTWQYVTCTYTDTGDRKLHLFLNGSEVTYQRQGTLTGTPKLTTNSLIIGNRPTGDRTFQGSIDEAAVYNRALSAAEIQALYSSF